MNKLLLVLFGSLLTFNVLQLFGVIFVYHASAPLRASLRNTGADVGKLLANPGEYFQQNPQVYSKLHNYVVSVLEQVSGRLHVIENSVVVDVSTDKEFTFLYKYMERTKRRPKNLFIIDIGSAEGVLGSNSFNLFQLGWSGLLVDPFRAHIEKARRATAIAAFAFRGATPKAHGANTASLLDEFEGCQHIEFERVALV